MGVAPCLVERPAMTNALSVRGVTKRYRTVTAVDDLSFDVAVGEIFALLGPNGAGKTTTVRMIQGILPPDEGRIEFGVDGARGYCRPGLGYLPEERGLYRDQPIDRILTVFGRLRGMSKSAAARETEAWLERFALADRRKDKLESLSKGNQQKVQFAAAILHRPKLAVLDEPFSGLDPVNQDVFLELLDELRRDGMTIVLSAHQMELVERCADRLLIMGNGRSLMDGTLEQLSRRRDGPPRLAVVLSEQGREVPPVASGPVAGLTFQADGAVEVVGQDGTTLSDLLSEVATWAGVIEVNSARRRLHDVYVEVVAEAGAGGPALGSTSEAGS